jgi:hypothetical protein
MVSVISAAGAVNVTEPLVAVLFVKFAEQLLTLLDVHDTSIELPSSAEDGAFNVTSG